MRILIVDDELIVAWNLKLTFERMRQEVIAIATTADDAIREARNGCPDLILMDIHLKGDASGIDAAKGIRQFSEVPIAYVTGNAHLLSEDQMQATRPVGVFQKPTSDRDLQGIIQLVLRSDET